MQQMFFGVPPDFDEMFEALRRWEAEFNRK
jgi:hypothetical protein